jgi:phosphate transport system substrate-binding protein
MSELNYRIENKDCMDFLSTVEDNSIDYINVDPPYNIGYDGGDGSIRQNPGSIGFGNTGFVKANKLQAAAIQNKAGKFVLPTAASGSAALNGIKLDANLAGENANPAGATAYPISTLTWVLAYKTGNGANAVAIRNALNYALSTKAQSIADDLGYVPLSGSILNRARIAVNRIGQ